MGKGPSIATRRRRVAYLLIEGLSAEEIASRLEVRPALVEADAKAIDADPNNPDYLHPKRVLTKLLDRYDKLEEEARGYLQRALDADKLDSAVKWFDTIRRITEDRGRVLGEIGLLNKGAEVEPVQAEDDQEGLSPEARRLIAQIRLAEKLGHTWRSNLVVDDPSALAPEPDPDPEPPATPRPSPASRPSLGR